MNSRSKPRLERAHREVQQALVHVLNDVVFTCHPETQRLALLGVANAHVERGDTDWVTCRLHTRAMRLSLPFRLIADLVPTLPSPMMNSAQWLVRAAEHGRVPLIPELQSILVELVLHHGLNDKWSKNCGGTLLRHGGDIAIVCTGANAAIRSRNQLSDLLAALDAQPVVHPAITDVEARQVTWLGLRLWAAHGELDARVDESMWHELGGDIGRLAEAGRAEAAAEIVAVFFSRISPVAGGQAQKPIHRRLNRVLADAGFEPMSWPKFHHALMAASVAWRHVRRQVKEAFSPDNAPE
jgi:hypothetical protein